MSDRSDDTVSLRYMGDDVRFVVSDLCAEVHRLRRAAVRFCNDVVTGPGGLQIPLEDPSGNPVELFQPAGG